MAKARSEGASEVLGAAVREIAALRARAERYREALEPFARYAEKMRPGPLPDTACVAVHRDNVNGDTEITIADLKRAQKALAATGDEEGKGGKRR